MAVRTCRSMRAARSRARNWQQNSQLFSDDAADLIHQTSRGLPRAVNNLGLQALVATFAANKTIVDESAARAAVTEVTAE
jgi:type II secretory pathway predicted ATPase ExeA